MTASQQSTNDSTAFPTVMPFGEAVCALFEPDLNDRLHYARNLAVLTASSLFYGEASGPFERIELDGTHVLARGERAGVGWMKVMRGGRCVVQWHFTLAQSNQAAAFAEQFETLRASLGDASPRTEPAADTNAASAPTRRGSPLWRLLVFARAHRSTVLLGFLLTLGTTAVGLIPPYLTMPLVDRVLVPATLGDYPGSLESAYREVALYLGGLALAAFVAWLLAWAQGALLARVSERISADLRNKAFSHLHRLSLQYFGGKRTGDLITRISSDTDRLCRFLSDTLIDFIADVLMIVGTAIVLFTLDPALAIAALVSFPPIAWFVVRLRVRLTQGFLRGGRAWSAMTNILADTIPGVRVVKAFSQEEREIQRFARANERIVAENDRVNALWTFFWPLVGLLNQVGLLVVWSVGAWQVLGGRITIGVLTAFIAYIGRFYARVESMSRMLGITQRASASAQRLFEVLDREPSVLEPASPRPIHEMEGAIRFEHVSFRYGNRLVLDDVNFALGPGKMVGIVGHTGSGKSTIANLVCRFFDVSGGAVLVDGVDIRQFSVEEYRRHVGIVLQDPFLFFGTIGENIAYGIPSAPKERILDAARAARVHDFVLKLPEGYDSLVGERGQSLSGGERQRVAIARALLVDPRILILDEATSAVDSQTERDIQRALDHLVLGRTTIAIAHRLSTLAKADFLLVLKEGRLVETGTHAELLRKGGEYARLHQGQASVPPAGEDVAEESDHGSANGRALTPPLDASTLRLKSEGDGALFAWDGTSTTPTLVVPRRCFPLSDPLHYVSLVDEQGHERVCIVDPSELDPAGGDALARALHQSEFLPRIERIDSISGGVARSDWRVVTDRGAKEFTVDHDDLVRPLGGSKYLITDAHGMRYLIANSERLDSASRRWLSRF